MLSLYVSVLHKPFYFLDYRACHLFYLLKDHTALAHCTNDSNPLFSRLYAFSNKQQLSVCLQCTKKMRTSLVVPWRAFENVHINPHPVIERLFIINGNRVNYKSNRMSLGIHTLCFSQNEFINSLVGSLWF